MLSPSLSLSFSPPPHLSLSHYLSLSLLLSLSLSLSLPPATEEKPGDSPMAMNALMRLNQHKPGLQYRLTGQSGPVHFPVFTMSVDVEGDTYEASGPSKRTAKLHLAAKVRDCMPRRKHASCTSRLPVIVLSLVSISVQNYLHVPSYCT